MRIAFVGLSTLLPALALAGDCDHNGVDGDSDCNRNQVVDACEGPADLDSNGVPDACEIAAGEKPDCNANGVPDAVDTTSELGVKDTLQWKLPPGDQLLLRDLDEDGIDELVSCGPTGFWIGWRDGIDIPGTVTMLAASGTRFDAADGDGDLDVDLALARRFDAIGATEILVFENHAHRRFRRISLLYSGSAPASIVYRDLDGDGIAELVLTSVQLGAEVHRGLGGGDFGPAHILGELRGIAIAADVIGGPELDLLADGGGVRRAAALENLGGLTFGRLRQLDDVNGGGIVAAELDADGRLDVATGDGRVHWSWGGLVPVDPVAVSDHSGSIPKAGQSVAACDGDGDGDLDLLWARGASAAPVASSGAGELTALPAVRVALGRVAWLDASTGAASGSELGVLDGNGGGASILRQAGGPFSFGRVILHATSAGAASDLIALDADGDGDLDIATALSNGAIELLENAGDGWLEKRRGIDARGHRVALAAFDWNADGAVELAIGDGIEPRIEILVPTASFELEPTGEIRTRAPVGLLRPADIDGDLKTDLIAPLLGIPAVAILMQAGPRTFETAAELTTRKPVLFAATGELNLDGRLDLAFGLDDAAEAFVQRPERFLPERFLEALFVPLPPKVVAFDGGDLDGDGVLDVAAGTRLGLIDSVHNEMCLLFRAPQGWFNPACNFLLSDIRDLKLADADADGDLDVFRLDGEALTSPGLPPSPPGALKILENRGGASFSASAFTTGSVPGKLLAVDLDAVPGPEVLVAALSSVSVIRPRRWMRASDDNGDGTIDSCQGGKLRRGDVRADGRLDIGDAIAILDIWRGEDPGIACRDAADADDNGRINPADVLVVLGYLFRRGPAPAPPFDSCGPDTTPDALGCAQPPACSFGH